MLTIIAIAGVIALVYGIARTTRIRKFNAPRTKARTENRGSYSEVVQTIMPAVPDFSHTAESKNDREQQSKTSKLKEILGKEIDGFAAASILGESAWYGAEAIDNLMSVDQSVYEALSHLSGQQLDSIADLNSYLGNWETDWLGNISAIDNLQGHVAEFTVAEHLRDMGHTVEFPETSNYPGTDMWVDGHPFNVKDVTSMSSIHEHFDKYPDIGVISNYDVNGIDENLLSFDPSDTFDSALNLDNIHGGDHIIDAGLNHDVMLDHTDAAADAITGNIDFHFPLITLAVSSIREVKIFRKGHTDIVTSAKNIGLDVAGVGAGGFLGGKAGALIGTAIFPGVGTAIGAALGAAAGAFFGKKATNMVKMENYENAKTKYGVASEQLQQKLGVLTEDANSQITRLKSTEQKLLKDASERSVKLIEQRRNVAIASQKKAFEISDREIKDIFAGLKSEVTGEIDSVVKQMAEFNNFMQTIWPSETYYDLKSLKELLENELTSIEKVEKELFAKGLSQIDKTATAFEVAGIYRNYHSKLSFHLEQLKEKRDRDLKELKELIKKEEIKISEMRIESFRKLRTKIIEIRDHISAEIKPFTQSVQEAQNTLKAEMLKLGLEPKG